MLLPGLFTILIGCTIATNKTDSSNVSKKQVNNDTDKLMDYDLTVLLNNAFPGSIGSPGNNALPENNNGALPSSSTLETKPVPDQTPSDSTHQDITMGQSGKSPKDCVCVPFYQCKANKTLIEDGEGIIDIRIRDGPCEDSLSFCCLPEETTEPDEPITQTPPIRPRLDSCGHRNTFGVSSLRIKGDDHNEAQFGEFPWMIAILNKVLINNTRVNLFQCGGSLLNPQVVLTAAHCVKGKENLRVRAGEWDTQTKNEPLPAQTRSIKNVVIHEEYYRGALFNDIALLFLELPVELAPNVAPICLPKQGESMDQRTCVASGWGKDVYGKEGEYQVILKKVDLPIVPRNECLSSFRKTILGKNFKLHSSFLCAGGIPNRDTCSGDGGSPLVCPSKDSPEVYVQAGIVSWGVGCNTEVPGAYVDVAQFRNWIENKLSLYNMTL